MDSSTANLIQILRERVDSLVAEGNFDEAIHAASAAVEKTQQALSSDPDSVTAFVDALEVRADLHRSLAEYDEARNDYKDAIDQLEQRPDRMLQLGRLNAGLGAVYDAIDNPQRAAESWEKALEAFESADPPALLDVAGMANNIAYVRKSEGDVDAAETNFLKALEILHRELGPDHEQAREMHMIALEARRKHFGDEHPDTAQSHNNLALALLRTGDRAWARRHFEKALHAFEVLGNGYHEDLDAVASNYCDFLREEGEAVLADRIERQVKELVAV